MPDDEPGIDDPAGATRPSAPGREGDPDLVDDLLGVDHDHRAADDGRPDDGPGDDNDIDDDRPGDADDGATSSGSVGVDHSRRPVPRWRAALARRFTRSAELWVPESMRDARVDPGRRGVMALLLVAALAASITAVGVWRNRPEERAPATVSVTGAPVDQAAGNGTRTVRSGSTSAEPATDEPTPSGRPGNLSVSSTAAQADIVVSVTGLVARPGVVTVPAGARVADAIAAAGGLTAEADVTGLNLAARLGDGDAVVVTRTGGTVSGGSGATGSGRSASGGGAGGSGSARVDLNSADAAELDTLPGVGPVMAGNIVAWREANGPFTTVEQLQEISGIGPARYAQLAELVSVS